MIHLPLDSSIIFQGRHKRNWEGKWRPSLKGFDQQDCHFHILMVTSICTRTRLFLVRRLKLGEHYGVRRMRVPEEELGLGLTL